MGAVTAVPWPPKKKSEECPGKDSNLHDRNGHQTLNLACLPIPPPGHQTSLKLRLTSIDCSLADKLHSLDSASAFGSSTSVSAVALLPEVSVSTTGFS